MGLLVDGQWHDKWYDTEKNDGRFIREESQFRNWVTKDGSAGPSGEAGFKAEPGRYHLYISNACPWANRTMIMRKLKGLEDMISVSVVNPLMAENGWTFEPDEGGVPDPVDDADYLYEVYTRVEPDYSGRVTVPVLYDLKQHKIVNNESSEIMRMLNSAFDEVGALEGDYYPEELRDDIDKINDRVYNAINNGVYKAGFATKQEVYDEEVTKLFEALDEVEAILEKNPYLIGNRITEADWRLFTTLIRFDSVYHGHFKCNLKRITDYENLWLYTRELYNWPGVSETINFRHIKEHYYRSHKTINPTGIVPKGPDLDFSMDTI
ncbi:putative glutathione S-transferase [Alkalibacterium putridalgicola]|uniref:Glutathione-dependent reductase n=1 Tax=Alkalibacterium putridalgicola TaxID=426703 RepID=A0A1H7TWI5_9LACT|nr:glutathione S-transferase family protein [Alkalibacterium putridalgicola]GEK88577.1 glutathione-dependent reductase [Alkalibacterium putridalgicola]SEL89242.1 putative glutathione S-transferase [Alkalibacterium putridalgicola]